MNGIETLLSLISNINFLIFFIIFIIILHFLLYVFRDQKYLKAFLTHKDPEELTFDDLLEKPLVTIIVPAWNQGIHFFNCLKSISELTYPNIKVIVNVGGSEETIAIANSFKKFNNFKIINEQGGGKIKALNKCLPLITEGLAYLVDADVYITDEILLRMIHPITNLSEKVVINGIRPLKEQENKDLVKYLQINRFRFFRVRFKRYFDMAISGANTLVTYDVIKSLGKFSEGKRYAEDRSRGEDIRSKGFKIYSLVDYRSRLYTEFPDTLNKWINQKIRWNENFLIHAYKNNKKNLLKFLILYINSLILLLFPFLYILHQSFLFISVFLLLNLYFIKIRRTIFRLKSVKSNYRNRLSFSFFIKIIFYIYIEALITFYILFELVFTKQHGKRKNLSQSEKLNDI